MDRLYQENSELFARNFASDCWRVSQAWINIQKKPLPTYQENYDYLKNWYMERNLWLSEYFAPDQDSYRVGDADNDGAVTNRDAMMIDRLVAGWSGYAEMITDMRVADVNGDGSVNNRDAMIIDRNVAGWEGYDKYFAN